MDLKNQFKQKLDEIAEFLLSHPTTNIEVGALAGLSGIAIFHFYYSKYSDDDRHTEKGSQIISETFNRITNGYSYPTYCDGISGALWALELLKEEQFIEIEEENITSEIDILLFNRMLKDLQSNNFDFLHGAIGYGYYFLKCFQNSNSFPEKKTYVRYIKELVSFFKHTAIKDEFGIRWESEIRIGKKKLIGCNLGLSHGVSSILNFLSRIISYPEFKDPEIYEMLKQGSNYILTCKNVSDKFNSSFPNWIIKENSSGNSRLAWCYGDLGIGISLLRISEILEDKILYEEAIYVLQKSTERQNIDDVEIKDAGMCHGAFGASHIYDFIYKKTGNTVFKHTSDFWSNKGLLMATHKNGYAGYMFGSSQDEINDCLLDGVVGVGLSILSMLSDTQLKWDQALMIG